MLMWRPTTATRCLVCVASFVVASAQHDWSMTRSVGVQLEPFQIIYITNNETTTAFQGDELDAMLILEATRDHLRDFEFSKQPGFQAIQLFPSFRSDEDAMFSNRTRVAFGGTAFYTNAQSSPLNMMEPYLCLLGEANQTSYVERLRSFGWHNLEQALLLTAAGDRMVYTNGTIKTMDPTFTDDNVDDPDNEMMEGASRMIYTLAIGIPLSIASILSFLCVGHVFKSSFQCTKPFDSGDSAVWKSSSSKVARVRGLDFRSDDSTLPSNSGDMSIIAAVGTGRRAALPVHPAMLRAAEKSARVENV